MKLIGVERVILAAILSITVPSMVMADITDVGDVGLASDGSLLVGVSGSGQRTINGTVDGPYPSITVGVDSGSSGQLLLSNGAALSTPGSLIVGSYGTGAVQISSGSTLYTGTAVIAPNMTNFVPNNSITIDGPGSTWTNSGSLSVGNSRAIGLASIIVSNGGTIFTSGANIKSNIGGPALSQVIVDGSGSKWVNSGGLALSGQTEFIVRNGGVATDGYVAIGDSYSNTKVIVDGAGSKWTTGSMSVSGNATPLMISNGAVVESTSAYLSTQTGQTVAIDKGGSWKIAGDITFGGNAAGGASGFSITNGGTLSNQNAFMTLSDGAGFVTVQGPGSQWINRGDVTFGGGADLLIGRLNIQDGGLVSNVNASLSCTSCQALVNGVGSQWISTGSLSIAGNQTAQLLPGSLTVSDGGRVVVGDTLKVWQGGQVILSNGLVAARLVDLDGGQLSGKGLVVGDVRNAGIVTPDKFLGVVGNYQQLSSGTLTFKLGMAGYDVLSVLGTASILGKIAIQLMDSVVGTIAKDFYVLYAKTINITGAIFDLPKLISGYMWNVSVVDVNGAGGYGQALDVKVVAVPEPSSFLLLGLGCVLLIGWRFITPSSMRN